MDTAIIVKQSILTRPLALLFATAAGAMTSFYALFSVVPLYAASIGSPGAGAGLATAALMLSTVAAELITPRLAIRFGNRMTLAIGLFLLGAPALAFPLARTLPAILAISLIRGAGFAILMVVGGALVAEFVPPSRRGEGLGLYGIVVGIPGVIALPAGVWAATQFGFASVFIAGGSASLAGIFAALALPETRSTTIDDGHVTVLTGLKSGALMRPAIIFGSTAMAAGIVMTFLPLSITPDFAALALLLHSAAATIARWWAGRQSDRHGAARLILPAIVLSATGVALLVFLHTPAFVLAAMILFGAGFGIAQNASLSLMFAQVPASSYGTASALWNVAYDGGIGLGAAGFGIAATQTGYPLAYLGTALVIAITYLAARRRSSR